MKSELIMAVNQICAEKDLPRAKVFEAIQDALKHAYRRDFTVSAAEVDVQIDQETGEMRTFLGKKVVEDVLDADAEIGLADARKVNPAAELDTMIWTERAPTDFGRIAAQTAKQVILQRIHEAERDALYDHFHEKEGELVTGTVQTIDYRTNQVTISLGKKTEASLAPEDQLPNERYRVGQTVRSLLAEVTKGTRGPQLRLSRTHRNMLRRLLEREIPEIFNGIVEIKSIAREPGQRSKVAVTAIQPGVDPVGACVGMKGTRVQNIVEELGGEKIDVVEWHTEVRQFIASALSPAKPLDTVLMEEGDARTAIVIVPDRQLSLAIGKEGQNARLAAKLTGWRIDIKSETEANTEGLAEIKRQQMQIIKTRALEAKVATAPPSDDLLSRAEWLLREKDKAAVTLEQAAQMLAEADATAQEREVAAPEAAAPVPPPPAAPVEGTPPVSAEPAPAAPAPEITEGIEAFAPTPEDLELEGEGEGATQKDKRGKGKKASKGRELVFDPDLGEVVVRRTRKRGGGRWDDAGDY